MDLCPPDNIIIDPEALEYNGFTLDRIAAGKSYDEFIDFFESFIESYFPGETKPIIIGQYVTADIAFLSSIFHYTNRHSFFNKLGNDILDTKSMANQRNALARYQGKPPIFQSTSLSKI
jgi:DNA polymerase III epsilon subunit-like protein